MAETTDIRLFLPESSQSHRHQPYGALSAHTCTRGVHRAAEGFDLRRWSARRKQDASSKMAKTVNRIATAEMLDAGLAAVLAHPRGFEPLTFAFGGQFSWLPRISRRVLLHTNPMFLLIFLSRLNPRLSCTFPRLCLLGAYFARVLRMSSQKLTKTLIDRMIGNGQSLLIWDTMVRGFGVRLGKSGTATFIVQYRTARGRSGKSARITIGSYGRPWTVETARTRAKVWLGDLADGKKPEGHRQPTGDMTVHELCNLYLKEGVTTKKASTITTDKSRIERHIKPLIGKRAANSVTSADIEKLLADVAEGRTSVDEKTKPRGRARVSGGQGAATRTVGLLGGIFTFALRRKIVQVNPVTGVQRFPDKKNQSFLTVADISRLGNISVISQLRARTPVQSTSSHSCS